MSDDNVVWKAVRELKAWAASQRDSEALHDLVAEINGVLDVIEKRLAELEGDCDSQTTWGRRMMFSIVI